MILPKVRDPRLVTIRRGGTLTDTDHHLLALWAASCAEHVLPLFESAHPGDLRPRAAIDHVRAWVRGEPSAATSVGWPKPGRTPSALFGPNSCPRMILVTDSSPRTPRK